MAIVVPNASKIVLLKYILNVIAQDGGTAPVGGERLLKLFTNNVSPDEDTVIGDLTEATDSNDAALTLAGAGWTIAVASNVCTAEYATQSFTFDDPATLYGYYITSDEGTPKLLYVERFEDGPYSVLEDGEVGITPKITLDY